MPRVAVRTDKAGRSIVKGVHAEEEYLLIDILSGCIVKSYMSVTVMMKREDTVFRVSERDIRWSATE